MRLTAWLLLAAFSALACGAATRPHYGGTLRVEIRAAPASPDPAAPDAAPLRRLIFDTLVRLDAAATPQPALALSWQHDAAYRKWQFRLRPNVKFHDGSLLTPAAVAASLEAALPGMTVTATADGVAIRADRPLPNLLLDLADNGFVFTRGAAGEWLGSGPFRVAAFEPGRHATLAANTDYWGGRPFLVAIEIQFGRSLRDQSADFELGKADVVEASPPRGRTLWSSADAVLMALVFAADTPRRSVDERLRDALAFSIDRATMHLVILQKHGEVSASLLPQWLSGYAFLFSSAPDVSRARLLAAGLPRTLTLSYDPAMRAARALAERIAVNARDAGLTLQVSPENPQADMRLAELRIRWLDPEQALIALAADLNLHAPELAAPPTSLYEAEHLLLMDKRVIPLFHLPVVYAASDAVRVFSGPPVTRLGDWDFSGVWLTPPAP